MAIPRPEYPRPQFFRPEWLNLNGFWEFEMDQGDTGLERGLLKQKLKGRILVPFCPESKLSGIGHEDFMNAVWYRRRVAIPSTWRGKRVLLHFQACDHDTTVWVNGKEVGRHRGGFTSFTFDLAGAAGPGQTAEIVVRARDNNRKPQAGGKQSGEYGRHGCMYTRTTGIWQTVWLEAVPETHMFRPRITPDLATGRILVQVPLRGAVKGLLLRAQLRDSHGPVCRAQASASLDFSPCLVLEIPQSRRRPWSTRDPHLYSLDLELVDARGRAVDRAQSYAGLRSVAIHGKAIKINGETVFQRLVLDQGFYPDGILTAPNEAALIRDIKLSLDAGFNGARLHQKVFEERFLYHADRLGYLVWGEFPDWGCNQGGPEGDNNKPTISYVTQWLEAVERDFSHPSLVGWCPLNETWQKITDHITDLDDVMRAMFLAAKAMDPTRPVLDTSGYSHRVKETDVYDCHDYEQNPAKFKKNQAGLAQAKPFTNDGGPNRPFSLPYTGQPYFVSEFGGIWWNPKARKGEFSWGYGDRPKTMEKFLKRFEGLCAVLLDDPNMFGYCYTQLTDVFQEQNGIYDFKRGKKFDLKRIRAAQIRQAAIEKAER